MAIEFRCSQCNQLLRVSDASAGKNARCPKCQSLMTVPVAGGAPAAPPPFPAPASPLAPPPPTPPAPPQPQSPFDFLDKGTSPPPSKPVNPFGDQQAGNPFGGPATGSLNPYASPSAFAGYQPTMAATGDRVGLPWEVEKKTLGCWFRTLGIVLGSPSRAFSMMKQTGGLGTPILYNMLGLGMPVLLASCLIVPFVLLFGIGGAAGGGGNDVAMAIGFAVGAIGAIAVFALLYVALVATVGNLIAAAWWHLFLMICGGARQGYETTFRVTSFTYGSLAWLAFIPYVGGLAMMIWLVVLLIIGLSKAHEIPTGKAALAVLLPFGLCCGGYILLIFLVVSGAILSAPGR